MTATSLIEEHLLFEFGSSWQVAKYDEHPIYREGIESLKEQIPCKQCLKPREVGSKAVDFVGTYKGQPYFIEVKDFRGHSVENRKRIQGELAVEVALKVRDTLAGLIGVCRTNGGRPLIAPILERAPTVLLWLEEDASPSKLKEQSHEVMNLTTVLRQRLRWLNPQRVMIVNQGAWTGLDLRVRRIPERVFRLRDRMKRGAGSISTDEFCAAWTASPQTAGMELVRLCDEGVLCRAGARSDRYEKGPRWDEFHDG